MVGIQSPPRKITERFKETFSEEHLIETYPILTTGTQSGIIHGLFQSYYVELGNSLGYQSVIEFPFFNSYYRETIGYDGGMKRSDISWLDEDGGIKCTVEFEKFRSNPRLKAKNLVRYTEEQSDLDLVILHYWGTEPRSDTQTVAQIEEILRDGFELVKLEADAMLIETMFTNGTEEGHTITHIVNTFPH